MRVLLTCVMAALAVAVAIPATAFASTTANFVCFGNTSAPAAGQNRLTVPLIGFTLLASRPMVSPGVGMATGRLTMAPLVVQTTDDAFEQEFLMIVNGQGMGSCTLTYSSNQQYTMRFDDVVLTAVRLNSSSAPAALPYPTVELTFSYSGVTIQSSSHRTNAPTTVHGVNASGGGGRVR